MNNANPVCFGFQCHLPFLFSTEAVAGQTLGQSLNNNFFIFEFNCEKSCVYITIGICLRTDVYVFHGLVLDCMWLESKTMFH